MNNKLYVLLGALIAFAALAAAVIWHNSWLTAVDAATLQTAIAVRSPGLTTFMQAATVLGTWIVYVVVLLAGLIGWKQRPGKYLVIAIVALALSQITRVTLNLLIHRPRPPQASWLVQATFYAFPSGHTALAGVGYGLAAWLIWLIDRRAGVVAAVVAAALTLLVAVSRVYLGVHWASDVIGSILFAAVWITLTMIVAGVLMHPA